MARIVPRSCAWRLPRACRPPSRRCNGCWACGWWREAGAGASRLWRERGTRKRPGRGPRRQVLDPYRAFSVLLDYGRDARAAQPQAHKADLEAALRLRALVLGVAPDDIKDVVAHALAQVSGKPRVEAVADPSQPPE